MTARENNLRRKPHDPVKCARCGDTGFVCVELREQTVRRFVLENGKRVEKVSTGHSPAYAPCPFCLQGYAEEFGGIGADGETLDPSRIRTPWGPHGYWRNRDVAVIRDDG